MPILVRCACGSEFGVPDDFEGRTGLCMKCGEILTVPPAVAVTASPEQLAAFGARAAAPSPGGLDQMRTAVTLSSFAAATAKPAVEAAPAQDEEDSGFDDSGIEESDPGVDSGSDADDSDPGVAAGVDSDSDENIFDEIEVTPVAPKKRAGKKTIAPRGFSVVQPGPVRVHIGKGTDVGPYVIERKLGGPKSGVFAAKGPEGRVALKLLPREIMAISPKAGPRFLREARALKGLTHDNLVEYIDSGEHDGTYYMVMELLTGRSLDETIAAAGGALPEEAAIDVLADIATGLQFLHGSGLIHRAVKPEHVVIGAKTKLVGLGLVRGADEDEETQLTVAGKVAGTPAYLSPEQARHNVADERSDLFSLGTTFFYMLTGELPFQGDTPMKTLHRVVSAPAPSLRAVKPDTSKAAGEVVKKLLKKKPDERYQSAADLLVDIEAIRSGDLVHELPPIASGAFLPGEARDRMNASAGTGKKKSRIVGKLKGWLKREE